MRKMTLLIGVIFLMLVTGCNSENEEAIKLGEEFIQELYVVDEATLDVNAMRIEDYLAFQERFSPYLTEKALENLMSHRVLLTPSEIAYIVKGQIAVDDITIEEDVVENPGEASYYDHSFTLTMTDEDGNIIEEKAVKGQMTLIEAKDGLAIKHYRDNANLITIIDPVREN